MQEGEGGCLREIRGGGNSFVASFGFLFLLSFPFLFPPLPPSPPEIWKRKGEEKILSRA